MTMPNFFIIGAQKAGTTSLYRYLDQHPQIYMSPLKEPFFFDNEINSKGEVVQQRFGGPGRQRAPRFANLEEYRTLFRAVKGERAIGEATPLYIYAPGTAERIKRYVPRRDRLPSCATPPTGPTPPSCRPFASGWSRSPTLPVRSGMKRTAFATTGTTPSTTATEGSISSSSSATTGCSDGRG